MNELMKRQTVLLLNGPNLNLLGTREPEIYGSTTLKELEEELIQKFEAAHLFCKVFQSNSEGEMIDWLHENREGKFLLLNPGAYTHTSIALRDAIKAVEIPFIEIHLSNIYQRESFRHQSFFSDMAKGCLVGLGIQGYFLAAEFAIDFLSVAH